VIISIIHLGLFLTFYVQIFNFSLNTTQKKLSITTLANKLDVYGGYTHEINDFSYDIGFVYYAYPDANNDVDFT
jgi:hypothetical protein